MNLLVLNKDIPIFPGRAGHEFLHTTRLAKYATAVGLVSMVHTAEQQQRQSCLSDAGVFLYLWENATRRIESGLTFTRPSRLRLLAHAANDLFRTWPHRPSDTHVQDLQFRNMSGPIQRAMLDRHWDAQIVVQSGCARWVDYLPKVPLSVLVFHDVRSLVYGRQGQTARNPLRRLFACYEAKMYHAFERHYSQRYDLVVTVSSADEQYVRTHYEPKCAVTIPIPVDSTYFAPLRSVSVVQNRIMFTGMMDHPPNVDAACYFAHDVLPVIQRTIPLAEFWIVGMNPSREVLSLTTQPGVVVTGGVRDIRPFVAQAAVVVVPLRFGSGMRNKILEAWAMNKCVVSTSIGAEGLDCKDGDNILISNGTNELANRLSEVLQDHGMRQRISMKGREGVILHHDPDTLGEKFYRAIYFSWKKQGIEDRTFNVVVDLRWMKPGIAGGIENLSRSFIQYLTSVDASNHYTLLVPTEVRFEFDLRSRKNYHVLPFDGPREKLRDLLWSSARLLHTKLGMDYWRSREVESLRRLASYNADVVLSMAGYIVTDMYPMKHVLVVHDLQHEYHPEFFSPEVLEERQRVFGDSIRRADHIIAVSDHTRRTVLDKFAIAPERVSVAHEAADDIFLASNPRQAQSALVWKKYDLTPGEYLFFPGNTWPHKNHLGAIEALAVLRDRYSRSPRLLFAGAVKEAQPKLLERIRELGLSGHVQFLGYCPLTEMPALYKGAAMLVYPSFFEGFGIPLVEAMWSGCPIVSSSTTCLPEIGGEAAIYFDPRSPEDLASAINDVFSDRALREHLVKHGSIQGKKFSWQKFTLATLRAMSTVALNHKMERLKSL